MMTRNLFSFVLVVLILTAIVFMGCSKMDNPVGPQTKIVEPTDQNPDGGGFTPPVGWTTVFTSGDYVIIAKDAGSHFEYEHLVKVSSIPVNWQDCYLFGSADAWQVQPMTNDGTWYRIRKSYTGLQKFNFCGGTQGGKWPSDTLMKHWAASLYFWDNRAQQTTPSYGGDLIAVFNGLSVRPATQADLNAWYSKNTSMSVGFEVIGVYGNDGTLGKVTVVGQYPFIFTNVGIDDSGNRYDNGKSYPLSSGLRIKVAKGLGFWLMASDENGQLLAVRITTYNTDGGVVDTEDLIYKRSIEKTATVAFFNILIDSAINQDTAYGPTNSYVFTFHVNRIQSDNSGWNRILSAWTTLPNGTEWINGNGYQLKAYPTIIDGSLKTWVGIRNVDIASGTVTDITGKTYPLSSFPNSFWFDSATYVLIEYNNNGAIVNGHQAITKDVYFSNERITSNWTFWTETSGNGGVTLNPGGKYKFTMTAPDTFRIYPALDDLLRFCYIETDGQQKIHVDKADKNPDNSTSVRLNIVLKSDGTVTYFGAYPVDGMLGGNP